MRQYISIILIIMLAFLLFTVGCARNRTGVPAVLEREMRSVQGSSSGNKGKIPGQTIYTIRKGDTLWRISKNYGVSVDSIFRVNPGINIRDLKVGQEIVIPASGESNISFASYSDSSSQESIIRKKVSAKGYIWPVDGKVVSYFGETRSDVKNSGIDILPEYNQKVVASKAGVVEAISDKNNSKKCIVIKHKWNVRTLYGGVDTVFVREGGYVEQGQPIGEVNRTGTGNLQRVHFRIYVKDKPVNPLAYLP